MRETELRLEKAVATLQNIERFVCDQHDHVSFAKAWMLMSKGSRTRPGLRLVPPAVMAPLQRRFRCSLEALSLSWPGSVQNSPRALVVWA